MLLMCSLLKPELVQAESSWGGLDLVNCQMGLVAVFLCPSLGACACLHLLDSVRRYTRRTYMHQAQAHLILTVILGEFCPYPISG